MHEKYECDLIIFFDFIVPCYSKAAGLSNKNIGCYLCTVA